MTLLRRRHTPPPVNRTTTHTLPTGHHILLTLEVAGRDRYWAWKLYTPTWAWQRAGAANTPDDAIHDARQAALESTT